MGKFVNMNGKLVEPEKAALSVFDHGVLYGDGVFEGIRAYNGRVFKLDEHIERLYNSAKIIMIDVPISQEEFKQQVVAVCKANGIHDGYIRPVITRGSGTLGLAPWKCPTPNYFIIADTIQLYPQKLYDEGLPVVTVATRRNIPEALSPMVKSLNYLNNIMAKIEAHQAGVMEAIMMNQEGYVAECTGDNIFMIKGNALITPPVSAGVLPGITRNTVMALAQKAGYNVEEKLFTRAELYVADEVFLTGTAAEVVPVVKIDDRNVAEGKPGEITQKLIKLFKEYANSHGRPIE